MKNKFLKSLVVSFALVMSGLANAGLIYDVNLDHGTGSVFGTIETDGTIGDLTLANILNVDLSLQSSNVSGNELQIFSLLSTSGSLFTASLNELTFDFTGATNGDYTLFWFRGETSNSTSYWCLNSTRGRCDGWASASSLGYKSNSGLDVLTGISTIATRNVTDVPEPSTIAVFALALMGLASRKSKKQA